ncbi:hypothetical protein LXA43DRAFT_902334 [Ganoderma leucocontextum]|nr:hypothetical protein LXA43DRAFT_902334 [Ganoderma leucocontextum]
MSSPTLIDDTNPVVQYAPGWIWDQNVNEVDHTRHGAAIEGLTASLSFYGSGVQVVGTLEPTDNYGQPSTTYKVDGDLVGTYNAPFTASGDTRFNVTFFSTLDLTLDNHEVVITNVNGTSPNTFWLDYFLIYTQPVSSSGTTTTSTSTSVTPSDSLTNTLVPTVHSTSTTSTTTTSSSTTVVLTALASPVSTASSSSSSSSSSSASTDSTTYPFSGTTTAPSQSSAPTTATGTSSATGVSPASDTSQSPGHSNTGKIVGSVVGGVVFLALLALLFFCVRRRRRVQDNIEPFTPQTRERASSSGTLFSGGGSPAIKVSKVPELSFASSTALTAPTTSSYPATASSAMSAQPSEYGAPIAAIGGASATAGTSSHTPISPPPRRPLPAEMKLQESIYDTSPVRIGRSPLSPPPGSVSASAISSDYAPSSARTPAPADTEASRARWYVPAQQQSRAQSLLGLLSSRGRRRQQDEDSGLRLYNEPALPPPYTAD